MKVIPIALAAHTDTGCTTLATALKITRVDNEIHAFTTHDRDATIDGVVYRSQPGLIITDIVIAAGAQVGNLELRTLDDEEIFTTADVMNGRWRNGTFRIFRYNWNAVGVNSPPTTDIDTLLTGTLGEVHILKNEIESELRDLRQYLQQEVGRISSQTCRDRLGGPRCRVRLDPPAWAALTAYTVRPVGDAALGSVVKPSPLNNRQFRCTTAGTSGATQPTWNTTIGGTTADGSVVWTTEQALTVRGTLTGVTSNQILVDSARGEPADFFGEGKFTILDGDNAGVSCKVKTYASGGTMTLAIQIYGEVEVGAEYELEAGCRKRHEEDCWDKFDNGLNIDAEPHRKGLNSLTQAPPTDVSGITPGSGGGPGFF